MLIEFRNRLKIQQLDVECKLEFTSGKIALLSGDNGIGKSSLVKFLKYHQEEFFKDKRVIFVDQFSLKTLNNISAKEVIENLKKYRVEELSFFNTFKANCESFLNQPINSLSGGQNQLIKILISLYLSGDIFIFDEPFQYMDKKNVSLFQEILKELKKIHKSILLIEHRSELVSEIIDSEFFMLNKENRITCGI